MPSESAVLGGEESVCVHIHVGRHAHTCWQACGFKQLAPVVSQLRPGAALPRSRPPSGVGLQAQNYCSFLFPLAYFFFFF